MPNNKVQNPSTQVPTTPEMNDRDFINDCLTTEKYLTNAYSVALHEMSHQALYQDVSKIFNETEQCQRDLFNLMFKKGWYGFEAESGQKLQQTYQQFSQYQTQQFPNQGTMQ
ncbi:coat F domain-containing protein [Scopulibacillus darangshiensis]|uniref:Coat F domain-containing protein n=1 Tax=Scopulibacillus darangshiensis TaxID=442528 RepID=A0A4R2NNY5_9BACL|nr:spore coat protein [Scopulibacillus darangshiensis]TCP23493.1 coat F domain-containing protein [Scopulibacillus darangshiensis]